MSFPRDVTILLYAKKEGKLNKITDEIAKTLIRLYGKNNVHTSRTKEISQYDDFQRKIWVHIPILRLPDEKPQAMEEQR